MTDAAFEESDRLCAVEIIEDAPPPQELDQERRVAIFDLIEASRFRLSGAQGPYTLTVARLSACPPGFRLSAQADGGEAEVVEVRDAALEDAARDYLAVCAAYREAVRRLPPSQIEAADAQRKALHDEASALLKTALAPAIETDDVTARRLFTLCCALDPDMEKLL